MYLFLTVLESEFPLWFICGRIENMGALLSLILLSAYQVIDAFSQQPFVAMTLQGIRGAWDPVPVQEFTSAGDT